MKQVLWVVFAGFCFAVSGQEILTLQECLNRVEKNRFQVVSESASLRASHLDRTFHWWSLLPDLSANTGFTTSFGRRLDPFTNTFATSSVNSQSFGLNSGITLFNGLNYFHKRKVFASSIRLDEIQLESRKNELKTEVAALYVLLCQLSSQLQLADVRIEKYIQLQRLQLLLLHEGRITEIDTLKTRNGLLEARVVKRDLSGELKRKVLQLNFLIGMPLSTAYSFDPASISAVFDKLKLTESFALEILAVESGLVADQFKSDRTKLLPTLSLSGLLGTGFSTNNKDYLLPGNPTKPYRDQLNQNLYEGIGLYLSVPLFNRGAWFKSKQLNVIRQEEISLQQQLTTFFLEKQQAELLQKRLDYTAKLEHIRESAQNLEAIYSMTLLLYAEGRASYTEIETALMEWQQKMAEWEGLRLELELVKLWE